MMKNERKSGGGRCEIGKQKGKRRMGRRECYTRFSRQEHEMLVDGIRKFGVGNWKRILCAYKFHEKRTAVDLKDKYRNILRAEERERSCGTAKDDCEKVSRVSAQGQGRDISGVVKVYGWDSRMKSGVLAKPYEKGFHVNGEMVSSLSTKSEVGERVEVCRPPAAMRLERLLCPTE